jgi:hypothetical protein
VRAADVRERLGLRSTWFRIAALGLDPLAKPVVYGGAARLAGIARGVPAPVLERRVGTAPWEPAGALARGPGGRFSLAVKPLLTTEYRVASGAGLRSAPLRVGVAPFVRLEPPADDAAGLRGRVRPPLPGTTVVLQRLDGVWTEVARATVDDAGAFAAALDVAPGRYRARTAAGRGFVAGVSPELDVAAP